MPIAVTALFVLLLFFVMTFILKSRERAGLLISVFLLFFFSYGHVLTLVPNFKPVVIRGVSIETDKIFFSVWCVLLALGLYLLAKTCKNLNQLTKFLNVVAAFLVIISLSTALPRQLKAKEFIHLEGEKKEEGKNDKVTQETQALPDIYYIILDGYASSNTLKEFFNYDNSEFINYLKEKGFYVATKSLSNYAHTHLSLASSLNMKYINYLTEIVGEDSDDQTITHRMIIDHEVGRFLRSKGYSIVRFDDGMRLFGFLPMLIRTTMLGPFIERYLTRADIRERMLYELDKLAEIPRIKEPTFTFAHIIPPHPPYLFGPNGEMVSEELQGCRDLVCADWSLKEQYLGQLIFITKKIRSLIDVILSQSETPPIIILQSDHGPASSGWMQPNEQLFRERMSILNAYYLPGNGKSLLYESITPVNTFRLIFNHYFNANYELLDDRSYFSGLQNYKFIDVTDIIRGESKEENY